MDFLVYHIYENYHHINETTSSKNFAYYCDESSF